LVTPVEEEPTVTVVSADAVCPLALLASAV
jgi:hypothetical protein